MKKLWKDKEDVSKRRDQRQEIQETVKSFVVTVINWKNIIKVKT